MEDDKIDMSVEIWKDIKGYEGLYQVSNYGRVRSLDRITSDGKNLKGKVLSLSMNRKNRKCTVSVMLCSNGKASRKAVSNLVYEHFIHKLESGYVITYTDGNHENLNVDNMVSVSLSDLRLSRIPNKNSSSKYKGVRKIKSKYGHTYYIASSGIGNLHTHISCSKTEIEAAKAYDKWMYENCKGLFETNESLGLL